MPCTLRRSIPPGVTMIVSSDQAPLRHMEGLPYRCFLPDLTGFESFHCAGPSHLHHLSKPDPTGKRPLEGIQPHCSGLWVQGTATSPSSTANLLTIFKVLLYFTIFDTLNQVTNPCARCQVLGSTTVMLLYFFSIICFFNSLPGLTLHVLK